MNAPGRNDPCPCGSGKKFKKCCIHLQPAAPPPILPARRARAVSIRPPLDIEENGAPGPFVKAVVDAVKTIDLADRSLFTSEEIDVFHYGAEHGPDERFQQLLRRPARVPTVDGPQMLGTKLGQLAFDRIPRQLLMQFIPAHDCTISPLGNRINLLFRSLPTHRHQGGTLYFSPHRPTVVLNGKTFVVGFALHVMQNLSERLNVHWDRYAGLGDVFPVFHDCLHFEVATLRDGGPAISFFDECPPDFWRWKYVSEIISPKAGIDPAGKYYYRVAYCPVVEAGDYLLAKTFLPPGYGKTPEREALERSRLPFEERRRIADLASRDDILQHMLDTEDFSALRVFHELGVPQVVWSEKAFYASPISVKGSRAR